MYLRYFFTNKKVETEERNFVLGIKLRDGNAKRGERKKGNIGSSSSSLEYFSKKISLSRRCECLSRDSARHFPWNGRKLLRGGSYQFGLVREAKLICCVRVVAGLELEVGWHRVEADGKFRGDEGRVIWFRVVGEPNSEWPVKMPPHAPLPFPPYAAFRHFLFPLRFLPSSFISSPFSFGSSTLTRPTSGV